MDYLINRQINAEVLHKELSSAFDTFEGLLVSPDSTKAVFTQGLSTQETEVFNSIVSSHNDAVRTFRIYDYVADTLNKRIFPGFINYKTGLTTRLHPKHDIVRGELRKTVYYADSDGVNFYVPVLEVNFTWHRDASGFCYRRDSSISYYMNDGSINEQTKDMIKFYNEQESIEEGRRRRQNIVNDITLQLLSMLNQTVTGYSAEAILQMGRDWFKLNKTDVETFVEASDKTIYTVILNDSTWWMNNVVPDTGGLTIRNIMYDKAQV